MQKPYSEIQTLLNNFTTNDHNWQRESEPRRMIRQKATGILEPDEMSTMRQEISKLTNKVDKMAMGQGHQMHQVQRIAICFEICREGHTSDQCSVNPESIYYASQQSRGPMIQNAQYGNTYNPNWRNHPSFSQGGNQSQNQNQYRPQGNYNQSQTPPQQAEESINDLLKMLLLDNQQLRTDNQ